MWQGVNSIGHFFKNQYHRLELTWRSEIWHVTWVMSLLNRGKIFFSSRLKICCFVYSILLHQNWIFYHFWQINYEWTFSIVNDHRSPWNFWCFFRDSNGTKMTHSWIGLTISWCLYHSRYEVWHKCDRENRLIWLYFWPPNLSKSWLWSLYVGHLVPGDVPEQLSSSTK